jgi:hypothetical protein
VSGGRRTGRGPSPVALAGWWAVVIGIVGILLYRSYLPIWIALIAFGLADLPRRGLAWVRARRGR